MYISRHKSLDKYERTDFSSNNLSKITRILSYFFPVSPLHVRTTGLRSHIGSFIDLLLQIHEFIKRKVCLEIDSISLRTDVLILINTMDLYPFVIEDIRQ